MHPLSFTRRQITLIRLGGLPALRRKVRLSLILVLKTVLVLPLYFLSVPATGLLRILRPLILIRIGDLNGSRIGHCAANTECYLCERHSGINVPSVRYVDLFFVRKPICNQHLVTMWKRILHIWPRWILIPIKTTNRLLPGWEVHEVGDNAQFDRDVHNLLDRRVPHLTFTEGEIDRGERGLRAMGIPCGADFVCLLVRDSGYLSKHLPGEDMTYHDYRDGDIDSFGQAADELASRGYYVVRMGVGVRRAMRCSHRRIIDYACDGLRNDFMDIYLGAKCRFCISTGAGWDAVPTWLFRKPAVFVGLLPLGYLPTYSDKFLVTTKRHLDSQSNLELGLSEIFKRGTGLCLSTSEYKSKNVRLIHNTAEEIRDVVLEMVDRLNGTWKSQTEDEVLQKRFWDLFPKGAVDVRRGTPLHGEIRACFSATYLRNNQEWLQ